MRCVEHHKHFRKKTNKKHNFPRHVVTSGSQTPQSSGFSADPKVRISGRKRPGGLWLKNSTFQTLKICKQWKCDGRLCLRNIGINQKQGYTN